MAGGDLCQLWRFCSFQLYCYGDAGHLCDGSLGRNFYHYGDVFALQWDVEKSLLKRFVKR